MSYRTLRRVCEGGFSEIFEVEDPDSALQEVLILKRLHPEMSSRPAVRSAFEREARTLRGMSHPDVVSFRRCFFDEQGRVCLLMERVDGESLDAWSRRHASRPDLQIELFDRVLDAVDYLHHRPLPVLHLDLKPDNILVRQTPLGARPTLIDFGIARGLGEGGLKAFTEPYCAPEQRRGGELGCRSDVHALGHILSRLLDRIEDGLEPARLAALRKVARRAADPVPRRRFADAGEMRSAFRQARATGAERTHARASSAATWRGSRARRLLAGSLLAILLGAGGFLVLRSRAPAGPTEPRPATLDAVESFHDSLHRALTATHHAAIEQHFEDARHVLESAELSPRQRDQLRAALNEVRRRINGPGMSPSQREEVILWLSEQTQSASRIEVSP